MTKPLLIDSIVVGAGPAGLTAAYEMSKAGLSVIVLEADPIQVGGISRTVEYEGYLFDIGGHRFYSKSEEVNRLWREILPDGFLERPRLSRIFYKGKLYSYPLEPIQALLNLGFWESLRCVASFVQARLRPVKVPKTFEDWVVNAFGRRLFSIFFKTYSEKVWGVPCTEISSDWAAQRIKGLDLGKALISAVSSLLGIKPKNGPKTLIGTFLYPERGPGMMWGAARSHIDRMQGRPSVLLGHAVRNVTWNEDHWRVEVASAEGSRIFEGRTLVSTMPLTEIAGHLLKDPVDVATRRSLKFRDYVMVALILDKPDLFPDNWVYVHDPDVVTGRIQNFGSWSPKMLPNADTSCLGMEYFCNEGDPIWTMSDADLTTLAMKDLARVGLAGRAHVLKSMVVRQRKAYPVYGFGYRDAVASLSGTLERRYPALHLAGRNGMHRYNNQDHAMMTGLVAARNIISGSRYLNPWRVNDDAEYIEKGEVRHNYIAASSASAS